MVSVLPSTILKLFQESQRSKPSSSEQDSSEPAYAVDNARFEATSSR